MTAKDKPESTLLEDVTPETVGHVLADRIPVELSTRFLQHFSEQLYSSPQKAFEELISNGWDAGADYVDVRVSQDLNAANATLCVLDNGVSMDAEGLRALWHIAFSPKAGKPEEHGRKLIGKFGIGKLATYVLASKLTYLCKAADGKIRRVTMDYGQIDHQKAATKEQLINGLELELFEVNETELRAALTNLDTGAALTDLITAGIPSPAGAAVEDEFGGEASPVTRASTSTWTLAVLSGLKPTGRELKIGFLKRMLEAALPFGSTMAVCLNGERLLSSKLETPVLKSWTIGTDLAITKIEVDDSGEPMDEEDDEPKPARRTPKNTKKKDAKAAPGAPVATPAVKTIAVSGDATHLNLPGIGRVTGRATLFEDKISGGKSDARGASNGFHVNVLGRVINQSDSSFGEKNRGRPVRC